MEVEDVATGNQWFEGTNLQPAQLTGKVSVLIKEELEHHVLRLSHWRPGLGRGLIAGRPVREKEVVCPASCLLFDSRAHLDKFLGLPGNELFRNRVVQVPDAQKSGIPNMLWGALVGLSEVGGQAGATSSNCQRSGHCCSDHLGTRAQEATNSPMLLMQVSGPSILRI